MPVLLVDSGLLTEARLSGGKKSARKKCNELPPNQAGTPVFFRDPPGYRETVVDCETELVAQRQRSGSTFAIGPDGESRLILTLPGFDLLAVGWDLASLALVL